MSKVIKRLTIPKDTFELIKNQSIENYYLYYHRFQPNLEFDFSNSTFSKNITDKRIYSDIKYKNLIDKLYQNAKSLFKHESNIFQIDMTTEWRLAIGLGDHSVLETSITLHPIYGFPYIPGSAIKGVVRNYIIQEYFQGIEEEENKVGIKGALSNKSFCLLFGSPKDSKIGEHKGVITFFDAYPTHEPNIKLDIMNPHYGEYYGQGTKNVKPDELNPPGDYYNPVPVNFLTVENTTFQFLVGLEDKKNQVFESGVFAGRKPLNVIKELLVETLRKRGIGAKTAVGYGRMRDYNIYSYVNSDDEKVLEEYGKLIDNSLSDFGIQPYSEKLSVVNYAIFVHTLDYKKDSNDIFNKINSLKIEKEKIKIFVIADQPGQDLKIKPNLSKIENVKKTKELLVSRYEKNIIEFTSEDDLKQKINQEIKKLKNQKVKPAHIQSLRLKNIGIYDELEVKLEEKQNVFIGVNGLGKTTFLRALALALAGHDHKQIKQKYIELLPQIKGKTPKGYGYIIQDSEIEVKIKIDEEVFTNTITFKQDPVTFDIKIESKGDNNKFEVDYLIVSFDQLKSSMKPNDDPEPNKFISPTVNDLFNLINNVEDTTLKSVISWLGNIKNKANKEPKYEKLLNLVFEISSEIADSEIRFKELANIDPVIIEVTTEEVPQGIDIRLASQGQQAIMGLVGYIVERMFEVYPDEEEFNKQNAIVIIDEIDSFLHPKWQRNIMPVLQKYFPKLQFIISTHSPYVVSSTIKGSLKLLTRDEKTNEIIVKEDLPHYAGNEITRILLSFMGPTLLRDPVTQKKIDELWDLIKSDKYETKRFFELQKELSYLPMDDRDIMLSKMEIIKRKSEKRKKENA